MSYYYFSKWKMDPNSRKWSRDDTAISRYPKISQRNVKRSCSTPINPQRPIILKKRNDHWDDSDDSDLDSRDNQLFLDPTIDKDMTHSNVTHSDSFRQNNWFSSIERKPKKIPKTRKSFLNRFRTNSQRIKIPPGERYLSLL